MTFTKKLKQFYHSSYKTTKVMIGKVSLGSYAKGILEYCYYDKKNISERQRSNLSINEVRAEIVYIQNLSLAFLEDNRFDIDYLTSQFVSIKNLNKDLTKFVWHQSFSFPERENISNEYIQEIALAFSKDFGFEENPLIVFKHSDTNHKHFHIVANRINVIGKTTADHFRNYQRTGEFCRKMEMQLGLSVAPQMHILKRSNIEVFHSESDLANNLRKSIDEALLISNNLLELKAELNKRRINMQVGRGVAFSVVGKGLSFKGSKLGREYSLSNLEQRIFNRTALKNEMQNCQTIKQDKEPNQGQVGKPKQNRIR
jgi:hypothetical protein